ncbi:50S ribosomal protein [Dirofilaria immitis]
MLIILEIRCSESGCQLQWNRLNGLEIKEKFMNNIEMDITQDCHKWYTLMQNNIGIDELFQPNRTQNRFHPFHSPYQIFRHHHQ